MKLFSEDTLSHYGISGQKWGERRWQNPDGTFNEEGKERYFGSKGDSDKINKKIEKLEKKISKYDKKFDKHTFKLARSQSHPFLRRILMNADGHNIIEDYHQWRRSANLVKGDKARKSLEKLKKKQEEGKKIINNIINNKKYGHINDKKMTIFDAYKWDRENNKNLSDKEFNKNAKETFNNLFDEYLKTPIKFRN